MEHNALPAMDRIELACSRTFRMAAVSLVLTLSASMPTLAASPVHRADLALWIEPDQSPAFGVHDWSARLCPVAPIGQPGFDIDHIIFDGVNDHLVVSGALAPDALAATGLTVLVVFRCDAPPTPGQYLFSLRAGNGAVFTDCSFGASGTVVGRCSCAVADGDIGTSVSGTVVPDAGAFPGAADNEYLAAIRWDPSAGGTFRVSVVRAGDDAAQVAATTGTQTGRGAPDADVSDLYIGCRGDGSPTAFGAWNLVRAVCVTRAMTDAELAAMVPADDNVISFASLDLNAVEGFVDHTDPSRLDASRFQAVVWTGLTRNVHIVIGPGESHCGLGALAVGSQPGIDNILNHACGRAIGLSGCGLTAFEVIPLTMAYFSSVHQLPFSKSTLSAAWAPTNGTVEPTIGLWDTLGDQSTRRGVSVPGARATYHLQRQAIVESTKSNVGLDAMTGMVNMWDLVADAKLGTVSVYSNSDNATGTYRIAGLVDGGDYDTVSDWTTDGPAFIPAPDASITVNRVEVDPEWDGFAIENIGGAGQGVRLGFFDVATAEPGARIGCNGLAIGGGRAAQVNQPVWLQLMELARIDYVGLCVTITNDSIPTTSLGSWWHDTQTLVRATIAQSGPDGIGGPNRGQGLWIPAEGNLLYQNRIRQRVHADLVASLAVELGVDLVSFPAFVPTYASGATTLYDGVHISSVKFGTVARYFEEEIMPWAVPETTGACCFLCSTAPTAPCPHPVPTGPTCVDDVTRSACERSLGGVYRDDGSTCTSMNGEAICVCPTDLSGDGVTNAADFVVLAGSFGMGGPDCVPHAQGDLNCDGVVNAADFVVLASGFGCQ